ncbi:hypothetical protein HK096_005137 [Nowakowskiella sp. JEL0078]|nr:hypothetical protein HK096_005137 [Nowakowskiella sp. JEL0078]
MGGNISILYAGTFPDTVSRLIILESLGPTSTFKDDPAEMRKFFLKRREMTSEKAAYDSKEDACIVRSVGGVSPLSIQASEILAERGLGPVINEQGEEKFSWRSDTRLRLTAFLRWDEGSIIQFIEAITATTLLVFAKQSSIIKEKYFKLPNINLRLKSFKNAKIVNLEGDHHFHLEEETAESVIDTILEFLKH